MDKSIQHFSDVSIGVFQKLQEKFYEDPTDMASFIYGISDELRSLGVQMIKETLEEIDQQLRKSGKRKLSWVIEKNCHKKLVTSLGAVDFTKTLFTNKESGEMMYLLDQILGLDPHTRLTEDAEARLLKEAVQTSYRALARRKPMPSSATGQITEDSPVSKTSRISVGSRKKHFRSSKII